MMVSGECGMLHVACCMLRAACCVLHVACCMLRAACCVLHVACCMLHAAMLCSNHPTAPSEIVKVDMMQVTG
jgi:hypothetical protein